MNLKSFDPYRRNRLCYRTIPWKEELGQRLEQLPRATLGAKVEVVPRRRVTD